MVVGLGDGCSHATSLLGRPPRCEVLHQAGQTFHPKRDVGTFLGDIDPLDEQLDEPRLFGRKQFGPEFVEAVQFDRGPAARSGP